MTTCFENLKSSNVYEGFLYKEIIKYVKSKASEFMVSEIKRPTRTRGEKAVGKKSILAWLRKYIDGLWKGISERLCFFDKDGTTNWSEAPAEGVFSILSYIIEHKPSLSVEHMIMLCRIVKEGPSPATKPAVAITKRALGNWQSSSSNAKGHFVSQKYMIRMTSPTVQKKFRKR